MFIDWIAIDCHDPRLLARFWSEALGYRVLEDDDPDEVLIVPPAPTPGPRFLFLKVPEGKIVKNRIHLDLRSADQEAEVERLIALGAEPVDIGQGEVTWVVLADPEGNEFCILSDLSDEDRAEREAEGIL
ncbi:MAG TPA: VOC family protein [Actinomycetota bacterium]|nr:VOC family protein [Actinomycetota bacterium]